MTKNYLLFDFGASHGRCMVAVFDGEKISTEVIHEFDNWSVNYSGVRYWDILHMVNALETGIIKAFSLYPDICSIGIDTWGCDFGYIDQKGKLLGNPVCYRDEARHKFKPQLDSFLGPFEFFKMQGNGINGIMGVYEMYAAKIQNNPLLDAADRFLMMPDLLNFYLTGRPVNEYTNLTMALLIDQVKRDWQWQIIDSLELPKHLFKEIAFPGTLIGIVQTRVSEELQIPQVPVIAVATHDTASAIAGIPLPDDGSAAYLSLGTWGILGTETDDIVIDEKLFASGFGYQGGCDGKTNLLNLFTGLWVIQQCYECWNREAGKKIGWDAVMEAVGSAEGGKAFIDLDAPDFVEPNPNMPEIIQKYCGKTGQDVPSGMGEIARCVYESLTLTIRKHFNFINSLSGQRMDKLSVVGGGSLNKVLCQWMADSLGIQVKAGPAETTSIGNILMQMIGLGDIESLKEGRKIAALSGESSVYIPGDRKIWDEYSVLYEKIKV
jgi:sugar (pentulose or hexulose) kinase